MEFVDRRYFGASLEWHEKARGYLADVCALQTSDGRKKYIDADHHACWRSLLPRLKELLLGKCWCCQTMFDRFRASVDHFRPKAKTLNTDETCRLPDGYWWLAFTLDNFRVLCVLCNTLDRSNPDNTTRGKGTFFPLLDPNVIATPLGSLDGESSLLLDPCSATDPPLLDFSDMGEPTCAPGSSPAVQERVDLSIIRYNLDDHRLNELRKEKLRRAEENIRRYQRWEPVVGQADPANPYLAAAEEECISAVATLRELVLPTAEYRAAVVNYLRRRSHTSPWLNPLVLTDMRDYLRGDQVRLVHPDGVALGVRPPGGGTGDPLTVLAGSTLRTHLWPNRRPNVDPNLPPPPPEAVSDRRSKAIACELLEEVNGRLEVRKNIHFDSVAKATEFVMGEEFEGAVWG